MLLGYCFDNFHNHFTSRLAHLNIDYSITLGLAVALTIKYIFFDTDSNKPNMGVTLDIPTPATKQPVNGEANHESAANSTLTDTVGMFT